MRSLIAAAPLLALLGACQAEQTQEGELPDVNVSGGQLPEYDVDAANVQVGTTETNVEVPEIQTEEEQVEVPTIDVQE